jgi:hypothetical protein
VSRSFQRHASTTYNDWSFWVVYVGENMPSSTGALGTGIYDLQQTYFCCHGSTETATYKPSLFDIIAKCHHDQALVTVSGLYKTTNAFGGASWVTSVPRVRLSRLGYRPITTMVLPREMDLANNDYTAVTLPSYSAMAAVRVDWDPEDLSDPVYHGKTATLPGGIVDVYNERSIADSGFVLRPEVPGLTASAGGSVTVGTHGCVVCWISRDNEGNLWRSAPSSPNTITIANPNNTLNVHVQTPGINDERILTAEIYLTQAGGSLYYLAGTLSVPYIGAAPGTSPVVSTAITLADAALASKQTLYTDSGELPHDVTPSASVLVQWRNRVWAACGEDRDAVRFSEELQEDTGINWSDSYEVDMPGGDGDVTGLAPFGDRLYIFKRRAIYALAGDGPDSTGNGAYPQPEQIVHGIGCVAQRSIVVLPEGVMFGAETGIFMVDGGGRVSEVGAAVNADLRGIFGQGQPVRISGAAIVPNTDLVAFAPAASGGSIRTVTPTIYVFDRKRGAWFTWSADLSSSYASSSAAVAANQDSLFFCDGNSSANGLVMVYSHALAPQYDTPTINRKFDTTWKTGWFSLPATGDEVRLYEVHGRFKLGNGTDTYQMDWTIETDVASGTSSYGVQSQLVTSTITGTRSDYHFTAVVRPKYQKGDRFRITITGFSPIIPTHTGAIELIGIDLIVGAKGGLQRVPVGNIATT